MAASSSSAGPKRLGLLLSETIEYCKAHWQSLVLGIVVFGALFGALNVVFGVHTARTIGMNMNRMGIDTQHMSELSVRLQNGDESAMAELEAMLDEKFDGMSDEDIARELQGGGLQTLSALAPAFLLSSLVSLVLTFFAQAYYAVVAVEGGDVNATLKRSAAVMLPLVGVSIWSLLRSFIWIPVIGIIPAIILGPRFVAAPLAYLTGNNSVTGSVSDSYRATRGYWGKIVGNMIVAGIVIGIVGIVLNMILGLFFATQSADGVHQASGVMVVLSQLVGQIGMAFMTVFMIRLSATILKNRAA